MNFQPECQIQLLNENARVPERGSPQAAGFDLFASEAATIRKGEVVLVPLGFATAMDDTFHGRIEGRSGMASKGLLVVTGVIDADYRGEWKVILQNLGKEDYQVAIGDKVAQVVFRQTVAAHFQTVSRLSESSRGAGGFGSTGR